MTALDGTDLGETDWRDDPDRRPPFRDGTIHVATDQCSTCVFRPGNLMRLAPGRLADLAAQRHDGDALTCHKTLPYWPGAADQDGEAICRGFYDAYANDVTALRLAATMGLITEQEIRP